MKRGNFQSKIILNLRETASLARHGRSSVLDALLGNDIHWPNPGEIDFTPAGDLVFDDLMARAGNSALSMERESQTYRVVGTNAENNRITLDEGLAKPRAEQIRRMLLNANAFPVVGIEPE